MRIIIIICLTQLLTGCVGLAVGTFGTFERKEELPTLTKESLISKNGEPDKISIVGKCEVFTYYDGYNWSGAGAFVLIVPLPVLLPTGNDESRYYFKNGKSVAVVSEYGEVTGALGYMCGSNECKGLAGRVNTDQTREIEVTWCG